MTAHRDAGGAPDRGSRLSGDDERFPGRGRGLAVRGKHLDLVAVAQFGDERRQAAIDLAAHHAVAELGMDRIGEVDRRRAARQRDQAPLRREAEDLVVEQLELGVLEKFLRVRLRRDWRSCDAATRRRCFRAARRLLSGDSPSL